MPVPHFGVVLSLEDWEALAERVRAAGVAFGIEPHVRFAGEPGEQATMFFRDPAGNALEFKAFRDLGMLFAKARSSTVGGGDRALARWRGGVAGRARLRKDLGLAFCRPRERLAPSTTLRVVPLPQRGRI